jgi:hypothetical protein
MDEIYISTDVEADGPIPGPHSLLSFASVALHADGTVIGTFAVNLVTLPDARPDPATMEWWDRHPEAWAAARDDARDPAEAMASYAAWLTALPGRPVFVGYPVAYDFMFVYWYLIRFTGTSPFSHSALDLKTYAMSVLGTDYRDSTKRRMPRSWFGPGRHTHLAIDDAIEQGELFVRMLAAGAELRAAHGETDVSDAAAGA